MSKPVTISITRLPHAKDLALPNYATEHSAGMDLLAAIADTQTLAPGERALIPTGLAFALPDGYEAQIRPRSGLALKHGISLVNSPGTIDADYRGEVGVIVINHGTEAFTIGKYGIGSVTNLAFLIGTFYITSVLFVVVVLGAVAKYNGFSIFALIRYIKEEILLVLGTSSSEAALPSLMEKMEKAGAKRSVVGLVVPTGYSFNLDGTNIYMTLATLFLAQATNTPISLGQELALLGVAMLTSKGASGVTGAGFITLAATLAVVPDIPIAALAVLVGVDRFMSECRALTNLVGNGVATLVVARWEGALDRDRLKRALHGELAAPEVAAPS